MTALAQLIAAEPIAPVITESAGITFQPDLPVLAGHFPGYPIVPGVFLIDAAEQFCRQSLPELGDHRFAAVVNCRFRSPVLPGDTVQVSTYPQRTRGRTDDGLLRVRCVLTVDDAVVAQLVLKFSTAAPTVPRPADTEPSTSPAANAITPDLRDLLPHRQPILLVDRVDLVDPGRSIQAVKAVSANEQAFADRRTSAAYPWPLALESWCQAAGLMMCWERPNPRVDAGQVMLFGGLAGVEFFKTIRAGSVLTHRVRLLRQVSGVVIVTGECLVDDQLAMTVESVTVALRPIGDLRPQSADLARSDVAR